MKNNGFSRFPKRSWEIWVSKVTPPPKMCAGLALATAVPVALATLWERPEWQRSAWVALATAVPVHLARAPLSVCMRFQPIRGWSVAATPRSCAVLRLQQGGMVQLLFCAVCRLQ